MSGRRWGVILSSQLTHEDANYYVYEYANYLEMGYTYDTYMLKSDFEQIGKEYRAVAMLKTLIVADEEESLVDRKLRKLTLSDMQVEYDDIAQLVNAQKKEVAEEFNRQADRFSCSINASEGKYAFFSVPYDHGWKSFVNGKEVQVIKVNGFMAVPIEQGKNEITFTYTNKLFMYSIAISLIAFIIWMIGIVMTKCKKNSQLAWK